jgi:hypothetical protein
MAISFEFPAGDVQQLASAWGCSVDEAEMRLAGHARAALGEYVEMYLGRRAFSRGSDMLEHRLALLTLHAFDKAIPTEAQVSQLFQTTLPASRSLIRATMSKYRFDLKIAAETSAKAILEKATFEKAASEKDRDAFVIEAKTANMVDLLNQRLVAEDASLTPVSRLKDSLARYAIVPSSYAQLCKAFGAKPVKG